MIIGEVGGQVGGAGRDGAGGHHDGVCHRSRKHVAQRHGAVVTAQAHLRRSGRLVHAGVERRTSIYAVMRSWVHAIPQRRLRRGVVRGMAEHADL